MFHNFGANLCHRHWSVICRRSMVNLLEDWDYVCCSPFYKDYGLQTDLLRRASTSSGPVALWALTPFRMPMSRWYPDLACLRHSLH